MLHKGNQRVIVLPVPSLEGAGLESSGRCTHNENFTGECDLEISLHQDSISGSLRKKRKGSVDMEGKVDHTWFISKKLYAEYKAFKKKQFEPLYVLPMATVCYIAVITRCDLMYVGNDSPNYLFTTSFVCLFLLSVVFAFFYGRITYCIFLQYGGKES